MPLYAGFDCSTQSLSVVIIDDGEGTVVFRDSVRFEEPFVRSDDPRVVHASPLQWSRAQEEMLGNVARNIERSQLRAFSGSAQQHGSVCCGETPGILVRPSAPIWMDSSTERECAEIETALGGGASAARLTGSRVNPRFTGPQIRKFARESPSAYVRTARIHLVSSYLASLLIGSHAAIDHADGSGMALMDIRTRAWAPSALEATAPGLEGKLPPLVPSDAVVGTLARHWRERFDLPGADVVVWSGDNPCSTVGTGVVHEGQLAISLGTSDTVFGPMREPRVSADGTGHVFVSPVDGYLGITVFSNGALARERVREACGYDWTAFSQALRTTPAGNDGIMILPWFEAEITPQVPHGAVQRFGFERATVPSEVRAVVEAQAMQLARHSAWMGIQPRVIHATGGAAANREILQVIADVFDVPVVRFESTDAAALGAAMRALHAVTRAPWSEVVARFVTPLGQPVRPVAEHVEVYRRLRPVYAERERAALAAR